MFRATRLPTWVFASLCLLVVGAESLRAQEREEEQEAPRVERFTFEGVRALDQVELRQSIVTEQTRCRGILFRPFCWVTDWSVFIEKNYLNRAELPRDELRLRILYFRRGYREAEVAADVVPRGRGVEVIFRVNEGQPTIIDALQVLQSEQVLTERQIARAGLPGSGEPLDLIEIEKGLLKLTEMLGERGWLDAVVEENIEVSPTDRLAEVAIAIEPGARATLQELEINGNVKVEDRTIRDALMLRPGRVLRRSDIAASRRSLYESNLFHEAVVELPPQPDSAKRLEITVREAPVRGARIGVGFNTVEFVQTDARFTHYNWMGRGRRLNLRGAVGNLFAAQLNESGIFRDVFPSELSDAEQSPFLRPTWHASAELLQPAFRSARNTLGAGVFAHRRSVPGIVIDNGMGANVSFTRRFDYRAPVSLTYRFEINTVEAGDVYFCINYGVCDLSTIVALHRRQRLSPLGLSFFSDRSDDPLSPTTGYTTRLDLEHASGVTISDFRYNRISGDATRYFPFDGGRRVLAGRVRVGWVQPLESTAPALGFGDETEALLHPRKRFYSGGSQSVRGYGENQLSPRVLTVAPDTLLHYDTSQACREMIAQCDPNAQLAVNGNTVGIPVAAFQPRPVGGRSLLEGNIEYRFPVWREIGGAVFVDGAIVGGRTGGLLRDGVRAVTPGFGGRYQSPVGPIRVDLGVRPGIIQMLPVVTEYLDEDGERRIVQLETLRRYDPLEDIGRSLLRQVLNRLTLHLSIGQPF